MNVDIPKLQLLKALSQREASIKREQKKPGQNPLIAEILEKDLKEIQKAIASVK